ncbi:hypothetical protein [Nocardiopsis sp. NRRL B-16309]|uniref:hypothetical protein n=1 Tax=Nocardiopsis sp. NRRL B-16309 TaxID=1519494 RepID=UPI000A6AF155|nr:hypothetical protein [Nocardiopsis sp. NRRL B-16309]
MENNSTCRSNTLTITPEALRAEADALASEEAPRRFAVFAMDFDEYDGVILAWGQRFRDGRVVLTGDTAPVHGRFGSLRTALRVCTVGDARTYVSWVDPEPVPGDAAFDGSPVHGLRSVSGAGEAH